MDRVGSGPGGLHRGPPGRPTITARAGSCFRGPRVSIDLNYGIFPGPTSAASNVQISSGTFLTITFHRSTESIGLTYAVECSIDLAAGNWHPTAVPVGDPVPLSNGMERVTYRDTSVLGAQPRRFMRATARK